MKDKIANAWEWYKYSAFLVGLPVMFVVCMFALSRTLFTGTCLVAGYKCQFALGTEQIMSQYLTALVGGEADLSVTPRQSSQPFSVNKSK